MSDHIRAEASRECDCARYRAERDALVQAMERVAKEIEQMLLGYEVAEDAPAMRWARDLRTALGSLHAPGFQKSRKVATSAERGRCAMDRCCGTCRYAQEETNGWLGCHRYPPSVPIAGSRYEMDGRYMTELGVVYTGYPIVDEAEWCGEWEPLRKERK